MTRRLAPLACAVIVTLYAGPARAQDAPSSDPPAHISFVDGSALLERDGQTDTSPASMPLVAGDRIRTQGGRVEVLFADGSALHLDANTVVDFQSDEVVRLLDGRIRLTIAGPHRDVSYRIDAPSAWVQITEPGEYRVAMLRGERDVQVELAVLRGAAELVNEDGRSALRAGERAFARAGAAPSAPYVYNSAAWDAFDRWSEARRDQRLGVSAQYLPEDVRPYAATFDHYGSWRYEQVYGYVWYPRVSVGWRPYYRGRWASLRPYGWTWIGHDPWGWPTHHYGRWGFSAGVWFWIPGRTWGPAWVSWAYSPGYVSWCPLGWNNRPVLQIVNVNVYGGRRYDPWHAWTVVPRRHFGGSFVNVNLAASSRIDPRRYGTFEVRDRAPETRYAMPRASAPIRLAGARPGYAVPRGSTGSHSTPAPALRAPGTAPENRSAGDARAFPAPARAPRAPSAPPETSADAAGRARPRRSPTPDAAAPVDGRRAVEGRRAEDRDVTTPPEGLRAVPRRGTDARLPSKPRAVPPSRQRPDAGSQPYPVQPDSRPPYQRREPRAENQPQPQYQPAPERQPRPDYGARPHYPARPDYRARPDDRSRPDYGARPDDRPRPDYGARPDDRPRPESQPRPQPDYGRPSYRTDPESRRAPAPAPMPERARPMPRGGEGAPASRPAPERRGPSGPGPSAAPPRESAPPSSAPRARPKG